MAFSAFAYADTPEVDQKTIVLPNVTVSDKMKLRSEEKWLTGRLGNFEIFSNGSEQKTRDFVTKFYKFHQAFSYLFPKANVAAQKKLTIVLCNSVDKFEALAPVLPESSYQAMGSYSATDNFHSVLVINLDADLLTTKIVTFDMEGNPMVVDAQVTDAEEIIKCEYLHFTISQLPELPPAWLEEGVAQFFSTMKLTEKTITWGSLDKTFLSLFERRDLISMPELFAVTRDSKEFRQSVGSTFSLQSLTFVHMCMFAHKMKYQKPFFTFIDRVSREPVNEAMFKQIFGLSYHQMEIEIRGYITSGAYKRVVAPKTIEFPPVPAFDLRATTDAENGRLKGEVLRLVKRYDDANAEIVSPIFRKHVDARLVATLGLLEYETKNLPAARQHLEDAVAAKVDDVAAYVTLARLRLDEALSVAGPQGELNVTQLTAVLTPLFAARELQSPQPELYLLIAEAWEHSRLPAAQEHLAVIDEGVQKFPRNLQLVYKDASLKARSKLYDDARTLCEIGLKHAHDDSTKERFQQLKASLPEVPAATGAQP
jgi:hypothetical protein